MRPYVTKILKRFHWPRPDTCPELYREFVINDEFSSLAIEGLVLEMLAETSRHVSKTQDSRNARWLEQLIEILHERFSESLSLVDISLLVNRHPVHIAREFRNQYGCTIGQYTRRLRIEFACSRLEDPDLSLSEIALESGFSQQSHFSGTFKEMTGFTPSEYRDLLRYR